MNTVRVARVVVGVTGSLANLAALHVAVAQARRADARLVAVQVWPPVTGEIEYLRGPGLPLLSIWQREAEEILTRAFADAFGGMPSGLPVDWVVAPGAPGPTLVATADDASDLLVVGSGRRGRLAAIRYGSVSRYCFSHAGCPVLAVPPPALLRELDPRRLDGHRSVSELAHRP